VDEWYERIFGARIGEGVVAQLGYARMLAFAPVAVIGQAVATAALPALSQLWNEGRGEELDRVLQRTLQAALSLSCLAAGVLIVLAEPIVFVVFERGAFTADHTLGVASYLRILAAAIPALVAQQIAARGFFARSDMWRPMLLGTAVAFAVLPLYLEFGRRFAGEGLAAAGAVGMSVSAALTLLLLRRVHGGPSLLPIVSTLLRSSGVAALAAGAAWGAVELLAVSGRASFVVGILVYASVSIPGAYWVGDEVMRETLSRLLRRLRRGGGRG
jgi:putative peptidoglycan lipid II flippase